MDNLPALCSNLQVQLLSWLVNHDRLGITMYTL